MARALIASALLVTARAQAPPANPCGTDQVRIALTAATDGTEMLVAWATAANATPVGYSGVVRYGLTPAALTSTSAPADNRNYTLCKLPSPNLHAATLTGLVPGQTYFYSIHDAAGKCGATAPAQFSAPRVVGDKPSAYPFTVFAYGDMGISYSQPTADVIAARINGGTGPDVIIHAGDISCVRVRVRVHARS
jgi:hypothetical protein